MNSSMTRMLAVGRRAATHCLAANKNVTSKKTVALIGVIGVLSFVLSIAMIRNENADFVPRHYENCSESFGATLSENMRVIDNYPTAATDYHLGLLGFNDSYTPPSRNMPVLATASSANHYYETSILLQNIRETLLPRYPSLCIYFYDIGLYESQKKEVQSLANIQYRKFPFEEFPDHVRQLGGYTWKPLIIQMVLREHGGYVLWVDASIRFMKANIDKLFEMTKQIGLVHRAGHYPLLYHTDIATLRFLGEETCLFQGYKEIEANFISIYNTQLIQDYVMKPWVACALQKGCMLTADSTSMYSCEGRPRNHMCHRFDQSVISILLTRLFQRSRIHHHLPAGLGVEICRSFTVPFIPRWINTHMVGIFYWYTGSPCRNIEETLLE